MTKILIVIDMQNDFIDGALGTKEAVEVVPNVIQKIKSFQGTIVLTQDTHETNYLDTQEGKNLPVEHCIDGSYGWELQKDIKILMKEKKLSVYKKNTFGSKDLVHELVELSKEEIIEEIQLVGLCTDICVISNALTIKVFLPETRIVVDESCCAGVTPESHKNALGAMKVCQIEVV